jgi:hypothetical protein
MKARELERLLELADEVSELEARLRRVTALEAEIGHEREIVGLAPEVARSAACRLPSIEQVARAVEDEWVAQGPLVSLWQRAVELAELAESSGADPAPYRVEVDEARRRVESARLKTRDALDQLVAEREALMDIALAAPFELPAAEAIRDDLRPEAARREALALAEFAREIVRRAEQARHEAEQRTAEVTAEMAQYGPVESLQARIDELRVQLPARVELPRSAAPSAARRLQRAGVAVDSPTAV